MEHNSFINYPGAVASSIYECIKTNPDLFLIAWKCAAILFAISLTLICYLSLTGKSVLSSSLIKKLTSPALFLLISILGIIILRLPNLVLKELNQDESQWIANAATWLSGAILWKDVTGYTGGPLLYIPLTIFYYIGDGLNYCSIRLFGMLFCILPTTLLVLLILKKIFNNQIAPLLTLPLILFFAFSDSRDFISYNSEMIPMVLTALCVYLFISYRIKNSFPKLFWFALVVGFFPFTKLQALPITITIALFFFIELIFSRKNTGAQKIKSVASFLIIGLLPAALLFVYLFINHSFFDFWNGYILQNLIYTNSGLAYHISGWAKILIPVVIIIESPELFSFFLSITVLLIFSAIILFRNKTQISRVEKANLLFVFIIFVVSYLSVSVPGAYYSHYGNLLPVSSILLFGFVFGITYKLYKPLSNSKPLLVSTLALIVLFPLFHSIYYGKRGIDFVKKNKSLEINEVSKEILKYAEQGDRMAVWGWTNKFYVETGLIQGTPGVNSFNEAAGALKKNNAALEEYIFQIKKNKPAIFLDASQPFFTGFKNQHDLEHENFSILADFIKENYTLVATLDQKKIFAINGHLKNMNQ